MAYRRRKSSSHKTHHRRRTHHVSGPRRSHHTRHHRRTHHRRRVGASSKDTALHVLGGIGGAIVGGLGSRFARPLLTTFTGGNDNFLDIGYGILGGLLCWGATRGATNTFLLGTGAGIVSQAAVDMGQNIGIVSGMDRVMAGMSGVSLVGANGKTYFLTPQQMAAYRQRRQMMGRQGRGGNQVLAGRPNPVSLIGSVDKTCSYAMADCL